MKTREGEVLIANGIIGTFFPRRKSYIQAENGKNMGQVTKCENGQSMEAGPRPIAMAGRCKKIRSFGKQDNK